MCNEAPSELVGAGLIIAVFPVYKERELAEDREPNIVGPKDECMVLIIGLENSVNKPMSLWYKCLMGGSVATAKSTLQ
jgi:hypothetical protein